MISFRKIPISVVLVLFLLPGLSSAQDNVRFNAYLDVRAKYDSLKDNELYFRAHHLGIVANASMKNVRFYAEFDYEDTPEMVTKQSALSEEKSSDASKFNVTAAWLKYLAAEYLHVTTGKFLNPLSFYQQRHFPILLTSIHRPKGVAEISDDSLIGLLLDGRFSLSDWKMRYFAGVVQDWTAKVSDEDVNNDKPVLGRVEVTPGFWSFLTIGVGAMHGKDGRNRLENNAWTGAYKTLYITDLKIESGDLWLEGVYHFTRVRPDDASGDYSQTGTHLVARYDITDRLSPWMMVEYADFRTGDGLVDDRAATLGVNYRITDFVIIKTEFVKAKKKGEEGYSLEASVAAHF